MKNEQKAMPLSARVLNLVPGYYHQCSEGTQKNFVQLGRSLAFTVLVCGTVLAASFCEFWLNRSYIWLPLVFIGTGLFYLILDQAIILGDTNKNHSLYKWLRIFIALTLGLFNSFLIDYYFFRADIDAARATEIRNERSAVSSQYDYRIREEEAQKRQLLEDIDAANALLAADLDSLNSEASGSGGSGKKGVSVVWQAKYKSYQADSLRVNGIIASKTAEIAKLDSTVQAIAKDKNADLPRAQESISSGINESLQLLHQVIWVNGSFINKMMSILILIVSMMLELIPLFSKGFYDITEYFEVARNNREACTANSSLRTQNTVRAEANELINENATSSLKLMNAQKLAQMDETLNHSKEAMAKTEAAMDTLEATEQHWKKKYPALFDVFGKPAMEKAYLALSSAIEKAFA